MDHTKALDDQIHLLRQRIASTETHLAALKTELAQAEANAGQSRQTYLAVPAINETPDSLPQEGDRDTSQPIPHDHPSSNSFPIVSNTRLRQRWPLEEHEYRRYGRQMIMPEIGLRGQLALKKARVLIVGVGGLGCPAAAYLAGAGVGTIGLVDGDTVEESNLHRQIAHGTAKVGMKKVESAYEFLADLNPCVDYQRHPFHITTEAAIGLFEQYDLVLDCTDHPTSRYLISDACVLTGRPLVSASALKTEGQLIVLNDPPLTPGDLTGGPCYRCVFPRPPPPESITSCGEGGILGPVVGTMGVLQALEAIKVLTAEKKPSGEVVKPSLLMFSAYSQPPFRSVRMRSRRPDCASCSSHASVTRQSLQSGSLDYVAFCGASVPVNILPAANRIDAADFARLHGECNPVLLIDVRDETQYSIAALDGSINVPWTGNAESWLRDAAKQGVLAEENQTHRYVVCRLGNDSQLAAAALMNSMKAPSLVKDIRGGFKSWKKDVDDRWPEY